MKIGKWLLGKKRQTKRKSAALEQKVGSKKAAGQAQAVNGRKAAAAEVTDPEAPVFDRQHQRPVIRASICTGEQVAGFKDLRTGRFTEIMLIKSNEDLEEFTSKYGISREEIRREW